MPETSYATPQLTFFASPHPIFPKKNELTTAFGTQLNFSLIQDCQHRLIGNSNRRPQRNGKVALVSDVTKPNFLIDTLEKELNQYGYATQRYKSETVLREYISSLDY